LSAIIFYLSEKQTVLNLLRNIVRALLLVFSLFSISDCWGQLDLVLIKKNSIVTRIKEGERIRFKRKDRDHFQTGMITGIHQDYFRIGEDTTYLHRVESIDMAGRPNTGFKTSQIGAYFIVAGGLLFLGDLITVTAVQGDSYSFDGGVAIVSAALVGSGVLMQFFNNNYFKIGRKKKIITMSR